MNKIQEIIYNVINYGQINNIIYSVINYGEINKNNLINIFDNLTNMERNIIFNKLYYYNNNCTYGYTILQYIYIYYNNKYKILIDLLKKYKDNININVKNSNGSTLLHYMTSDKDMDILKLIYELYKDVNVSINILNNYYENVLFSAIIYRKTNKIMIRFLLEKGVRIQYKLLEHLIYLYNNDRTGSEKFLNINMDILLEYLHKNENNQYDYVLEELYKYVMENYEINEDNKEFYDKIFVIKSNTKSAAKVLAPSLSVNIG